MSMQIDSTPSISTLQRTTLMVTDAGVQPVTGVPFSDRVAGKTYSTHVLPLEHEYKGRGSNLPGACTVGATVDQVEGKLSGLINFFA